MSTKPAPEMSELERLEFSRRADLAYSVIGPAARKFTQKRALEDRIEETSKSLKRPWYWIFFVSGIAFHYFTFTSEGEVRFGLGAWVAVMALVSWGLKQYSLDRLRSEREQCTDKLSDYEVTWNGATGRKTFSDIQRFACELGFDDNDEKFRDWWHEQRSYLLEKACGYEKAAQISEHSAKRREAYEEAMAEFQATVADLSA